MIKVASWTYNLGMHMILRQFIECEQTKIFISHSSSSQIAKMFSKDKNGPIFGFGQDRKKIQKYLFHLFSLFQFGIPFPFRFIDLLHL